MKDANIKLSNESVKLIVFILMYLIVSGIVGWYVIKPQFQRVNELNNEISKQEEHLNLLVLAQERINTITNDINNFTQRISTLQKVLPPEKNEFLYGEEFLLIANSCNVSLTNMQFPTSQNTTQQNVEFTINFQAKNLSNVNLFINVLKGFPQLTEVNNLNISKGQQLATGTVSQEVYTVSIKGIIYLSQRK